MRKIGNTVEVEILFRFDCQSWKIVNYFTVKAGMNKLN